MPTEISERLIDSVRAQLRANKRVRRSLPHGGRLHIDRQLPFLSVYRHPPGRLDPGTDRLVYGEASHIVASAAPDQVEGTARLVDAVAAELGEIFGAVLLLEIWSGPEVTEDEKTDPEALRPFFRIHAPDLEDDLTRTAEALERGLKRVRVHRKPSETHLLYDSATTAPGLPTLLSRARMNEIQCHALGLEVRPVYRNAETDEHFPLVLRALHRGVARALKQAFFEFARRQTTHRPPHFHALGRRAVTRAVWDVDRKMSAIDASFDFLLQVTPINISQAWEWFREHRFERPPVFHYRPLPVDPPRVKRELFSIDLERVEDPTLGSLFREKRTELDRQLTLLLDRDSPNFIHGSLQLYGGVDESLREAALDILNRLPGEGRDEMLSGTVAAEEFAARARRHLARYQAISPQAVSSVEITNEVIGLMVSHGTLLVGAGVRIPENRVEALLEHEIGTHILTYLNGRAQRFHLLATGLAGYEDLQEGLAVLAEYLCGAVTHDRLRLLAARVLAAHHLQDGATFVETFRALERDHGFDERAAYRITSRIFRGGGLTKDAVYLRGLHRLLAFLRSGGDLEPLYIGKIAESHVPIVEELRHRGVLEPAPLLPACLSGPRAKERLPRLAAGLKPVELVESPTP